MSTTASFTVKSDSTSEVDSGLAAMKTDSPYERIDSQKGEIRLLKIQPGAYDDDLVMTIEFVVLSDKSTYQALSYVWGDNNHYYLLSGRDHIFTQQESQPRLAPLPRRK